MRSPPILDMKLFGRKQAPPSSSAPVPQNAAPAPDARVLDAVQALQAQLSGLERKLDRAWAQIEFLRTHGAAYLGDEIALTHLADETPIFINSNDYGCPMHFLDGGRYEEDNLRMLLSFVTGSTVFLDIGANLGFFTLQVAQRIKHSGGRVLAFEPHPKVCGLLQRSLYQNALIGVAEAHNFCLSDRHGPTELYYPPAHIGGGMIHSGAGPQDGTRLRSELKTLDSVVGAGFSCDLAKIDVEGHELQVLHGMRQTLANSPAIKLLIEKLSNDADGSRALHDFLRAQDMALYGVGAYAQLVELGTESAFQAWQGYVLALRPQAFDGVLDRNRYSVYPRQLNLTGRAQALDSGLLSLEASDGLLFHGPYWFLPRGVWRLRIDGEIEGRLDVDIAERYGWLVSRLAFDSANPERDFVCEHDLVKFECAARAQGKAAVRLRRLELIRIG